MRPRDHFLSRPAEAATFALLLGVHPTLLHRDEIRREIANQVGVDDALERFVRNGLVHRVGDFYWATRTAMAAEEACTADEMSAEL